MMAAVVALGLAKAGRTGLARASIAICLVLSVGLFLREVYDPQYGFAMPWLQG